MPSSRNSQHQGSAGVKPMTREEIRAFLGTDPFTARRRFVTKTIKDGKREAQKALTALLTEVEGGKRPKSKSTVGDLLDAWFEGSHKASPPRPS